MRIHYITRGRRGYGGMQRLSADLLRAFGQQKNGSFASAFLHARRGDAILLGGATLAPFGALLKTLVPRARVVLIAAGLDLIYPSRLYQFFLRRSLPSMDVCIAISRHTRDLLCSRGVREERITVIPCGIWPRKSIRPPVRSDAAPQLISIGRLIPRKGFAWFIDKVLPLLVRDFPELTYHVIGEGSQQSAIERAVCASGMQKHVVLHGGVSDSRRDALLDQSNLLVVPNIVVPGDCEGFGIVCVEAAARGIPVAAARLEGLQDAVLPDVTGIFFPPGEAPACARAVESALRQSWNASAIANAAMDHYAWPKLLPQFLHDACGS